MDNEVEAAAELERLRRELLDFVVTELTLSLASKKEPILSKAVTDAIDREVARAVQAHIDAKLPDLDKFLEDLLARADAVGGRGVERPRGKDSDPGAHSKGEIRGRRDDGPGASSTREKTGSGQGVLAGARLLWRGKDDEDRLLSPQRISIIVIVLATFLAILILSFGWPIGRGTEPATSNVMNSVAEDESNNFMQFEDVLANGGNNSAEPLIKAPAVTSDDEPPAAGVGRNATSNRNPARPAGNRP
jgi:hypothetical protein